MKWYIAKRNSENKKKEMKIAEEKVKIKKDTVINFNLV
jgi:hypothetical protein